jgi:competence protein ComEA
MAPWNTTPLCAPTSPPPPSSVIARVRASAWAPIALRIGAVAIALLVLAWIGRAAAAAPEATPSAASTDADTSSASRAPPVDASAPPAWPVAAPPAPVAPAVPQTGSRARASASDPVFLNYASVDELRRLPGVGPKRAEAILVLRQRLGRFQRMEDLLRVKGIGRAAVKKWRPLVRLDTPSLEIGIDGGLR